MNKNFGYKILIIDDDKDLTKIISDMLTSYGFKVSCAENADSAFEILTKKTFHIILLDINLPEGDGFEVCRELRRTSAVPIIFASARSSESAGTVIIPAVTICICYFVFAFIVSRQVKKVDVKELITE